MKHLIKIVAFVITEEENGYKRTLLALVMVREERVYIQILLSPIISYIADHK